jgi:hypothetical protein
MEEIPVMNSRVFQLLVVLLVVAFCVSGAMAGEVPHHWAVKALPKTHHSNAATLTKNLYGTVAAFVGTPYATSWTSPINLASGDELWPCFGGSTSSTGFVAETECNQITPNSATTDPEYYLPEQAGVFGIPAYTWSLSACDQSTTADTENPCGQTDTWYEDDTLDATDELIYSIIATQTQGTIAASGTVDFGPNSYAATAGQNIIISGDQGFGTQGATGANNGNCAYAYNYPLASAANPGETYVVPAGKTCVNPVAGLVTLAATTEVGKPGYTKVTKGTVYGVACSVAAPCYTTKWTKVYSLAQKFTIWLE